MSADIRPLTRPTPRHLTASERQDAAAFLAARRLGMGLEAADELVRQLQAARMELTIRALACQPSASATDAGGVRYEMEAIEALKE